jgi:RNA recognition motif-containing protein
VSTRLFVGNLAYTVTENELQDLFAQHGTVAEVNLMLDQATGRPRGFAFVTLAYRAGSENAIQALQGKEFNGRPLTVNEARPREERPPGGASGGRGDRPPRRDNGGGGGQREWRE